jgi:hypothetical protein
VIGASLSPSSRRNASPGSCNFVWCFHASRALRYSKETGISSHLLDSWLRSSVLRIGLCVWYPPVPSLSLEFSWQALLVDTLECSSSVSRLLSHACHLSPQLGRLRCQNLKAPRSDYLILRSSYTTSKTLNVSAFASSAFLEGRGHGYCLGVVNPRCARVAVTNSFQKDDPLWSS